MYYAMQVLQADKCKCVHITYSIYMHTYLHTYSYIILHICRLEASCIHTSVCHRSTRSFRSHTEESHTIMQVNHPHIHTYIHKYIHTYLLTYLFIYPNIFLPSYIETYICKCLYLYPHTHSHIHTYTCTYPYTYIQTYIHTYTRQQGSSFQCGSLVHNLCCVTECIKYVCMAEPAEAGCMGVSSLIGSTAPWIHTYT